MATRTLQDGTQETATHFPDGSVGIIHADPKTGRVTHYDSARMPLRGMPMSVKGKRIETALIIAVVLFFLVGLIVAAYCAR